MLVCHQYDVCENYVGSVNIGGYGGLSGLMIVCVELTTMADCIVC